MPFVFLAAAVFMATCAALQLNEDCPGWALVSILGAVAFVALAWHASTT